MKNLFLLLVTAFALGSCNMSYEKTKSGVRYKIIKGKGGEKLKIGDFIKFNQVIMIPERDTVLSTSYGKLPGYVKIDTARFPPYHFAQVFQYLSVGDSAVVVLSVDSLVNKQMIEKYDDVFRRGGQISVRLKILKKFASEKEMNEEYEKDYAVETKRLQKEQEESMKEEMKKAEGLVKQQRTDIEDYLKKNNIQAVKTPSGAYVEVKQKGTGTGDSTMDIVVVYTGKLFKEGTEFDSNAGSGTGLRFSLGQGTVVKGFDEGLMMFGKGGKGRIFIPSDLGYGPRANGPIPANSALIFEVEVHDLQKRTGGVMPMPVQVNLAGGAPAGHSKDDGHGH